jgi:maltooligosyltrehalose trehalohydrolase
MTSAEGGAAIRRRHDDAAVPVDRFAYAMPFGAECLDDGGVRFRLWAPDAERVTLQLEGVPGRGEVPLPAGEGGWREAIVAEAAAGCRYRFRIGDGLAVPDPASRFQPEDVHGPSEVIDPRAYRWACSDWRGRPWEETVLYELHVGTFTPEGTFRAAIEHLDELAALGVTAIELMPVADFPGGRDWGYDGVALFAPDSAYGRPDDLKALIDAAHARRLMVFLDVVYNHFGPEGNYLGLYAGRFFDAERHTPWGAAIDFAHKAWVRRFFVDNALYWLDEYRFDGLRFDAVHAIDDPSSPDIIEEIAAAVRARVPADRHVHLVLENDDNVARCLRRDDGGRPVRYVAQWNDDIHHALHVLLTGEGGGYYAEYAEGPARWLARCLAEGFAWQGEPSVYRSGAGRGEPSAHLPPTAFVSFLQNHDQIGNRAFGERLAELAPPEALRAGLAMLLLAPAVPLLFMGEEWGSRRPFLFFCDLGGDLRAAVRDGRRREFAGFPAFAAPEARARIPDPTAEETFVRSRLDRSEAEAPEHAAILAWTRRLLALRHREIVPRLAGTTGGAGRVLGILDRALTVTWTLGDGSRLSLRANLAATAAPASSLPVPTGRLLLTTHPGDDTALLLPWSVIWTLDETTAEALP